MCMLYFRENRKDAPSPINMRSFSTRRSSQHFIYSGFSSCCSSSTMSPPISEDSKSNTNSWIKRLRVDCLLSISRFASGNTSSGNSDEPQMIPDPTTSSTGSESSGIVSPLSLSGFESPSPLVACEDLQYVGLPSSLAQPCPKIDVHVGKYHDGPRDLTCYITRIDDNPCGHGGSSNVS